MTPAASAVDFFDQLYADDPHTDPWRFRSSAYERRRYATLLEALPRCRYRSGFEPGCSVGELSALLARRCDKLLAMDFVPRAVDAAAARHGMLGNVEFRCGTLPQDLSPGDGPFDLIVLAELGYYFDPAGLRDVLTSLAARLCPGGDLLAEHWTGVSADHVMDAEQTHGVIRAALGPRWVTRRQRHEGFLLDLWRRPL